MAARPGQTFRVIGKKGALVRKSAALASELLGDAGGDPADQRALASALAARLWARREDLSVVTRRVAAESARQTADRLRIK